jgi:ABC-2 type transport system permease protein
MKRYWKIFRVSLTERLTYRADFMLATFLRFLPMITTILLWQAVYAGSGQEELNGYTYHNVVAYLLAIHLSRMFSSMPGLAPGIARDIRDGNLKKYLLQPIDMHAYLLAYRGAHKVAYITTAALPYGLLFYLCRGFFDGLPEVPILAAYLLSLLLAFLLGFFIEVCVGMVGFWTLEVTSVLYVFNALNYFVSGQMFPLDLLPQPWAGLVKLLPFQYLAYFPAAMFVGKLDSQEVLNGLIAQAAWVLVFAALARLLYRAGLKRYSAFGG